MKILVGTICSLLALGGIAPAQAAVTFDFNALANEDDPAAISSYMTGVYGSGVTVTDAEVDVTGDNAIDTTDWAGNATPYLVLNDGSGDFEIVFSTPILSVSGLGYIFRSTIANGTPAFSLVAYDASYADAETPNPVATVASLTSYANQDNTPLSFSWVFTRPVSLLRFTNEGTHDVGIDDLTVAPIPEPASLAAWSIMSGVGLILARRRRLRQ